MSLWFLTAAAWLGSEWLDVNELLTSRYWCRRLTGTPAQCSGVYFQFFTVLVCLHHVHSHWWPYYLFLVHEPKTSHINLLNHWDPSFPECSTLQPFNICHYRHLKGRQDTYVSGGIFIWAWTVIHRQKNPRILRSLVNSSILLPTSIKLLAAWTLKFWRQFDKLWQALKVTEDHKEFVGNGFLMLAAARRCWCSQQSFTTLSCLHCVWCCCRHLLTAPPFISSCSKREQTPTSD